MLKLRITESIQFSFSRLGFLVILSRLFKSSWPLNISLSSNYVFFKKPVLSWSLLLHLYFSLKVRSLFASSLMHRTIQSELFVVVQSLSHIWLCDSMDGRMPVFPILRYLQEFAQTHVHWVSDAIQPSYPLSPPFPPAPRLAQHQSFSPMSELFTSGVQSIGASASVLLINIQGWFPLGLTGLISFLFKGLSPSLFVWYASCIFHFQSFSKFTGHLWFFQWSCMDVRVRLWRKLSAE